MAVNPKHFTVTVGKAIFTSLGRQARHNLAPFTGGLICIIERVVVYGYGTVVAVVQVKAIRALELLLGSCIKPIA